MQDIQAELLSVCHCSGSGLPSLSLRHVYVRPCSDCQLKSDFWLIQTGSRLISVRLNSKKTIKTDFCTSDPNHTVRTFKIRVTSDFSRCVLSPDALLVQIRHQSVFYIIPWILGAWMECLDGQDAVLVRHRSWQMSRYTISNLHGISHHQIS